MFDFLKPAQWKMFLAEAIHKYGEKCVTFKHDEEDRAVIIRFDVSAHMDLYVAFKDDERDGAHISLILPRCNGNFEDYKYKIKSFCQDYPQFHVHFHDEFRIGEIRAYYSGKNSNGFSALKCLQLCEWIVSLFVDNLFSDEREYY